MPVSKPLPRHLRAKRAKVFTDGKQTPIDPNDRARAMWQAEVARRKGLITSAHKEVFQVLIFVFANLKDGRCFPSRKTIAKAAGRCERTVARAIEALERTGLLTWVNRLRRVRERVAGLGGIWAATWRVMRTSNSYSFPSLAKKLRDFVDKGQNGLGTTFPDTFLSAQGDLDLENELGGALFRLGKHLKAI